MNTGVINPDDVQVEVQMQPIDQDQNRGRSNLDRLVTKDGKYQLSYSGVARRKRVLFRDFFTTMLELRWRYHAIILILSFVVSWILFGLIYLAIASADSYDPDDEDDVACITGVVDFPSALLYSIETQTTIGYGTRAVTTACASSMCIMMFQSLFGMVFQCVMTGIIFAKMARPKRRSQTISFSNHAVRLVERGVPVVLKFRVGDLRRSHIIGVSITLQMVFRHNQRQGKILEIHDLPVKTETGGTSFNLSLPLSVVHVIDENSPLLNPPHEDWELIATLEGTAETSGASFRVSTSYLPSEIKNGNLLPLVSESNVIDFAGFNDVVNN